ncbi:MAG: hydroxymethylbilane synthase [Deltaproteobacteria bacterium]|nr:hydroxymethylbilane synthase [Deltaproteobacteria bacterium]MBW2660800.1 hydroxymethylbilane synthase [Deltaproteobacteria bacterium]
MKKNIKIGTRGSNLALWQARWVQSTLQTIHPSFSFEIVTIKTKGDKILDVPLAKVGGKGLFVKEIEEALLDKRIDLAVHSMKDMPAEVPDGLCIGAVPERESPQDVLISQKGVLFSELSTGAGIGTSSLRRSSQLLHLRPDLKILPLRGNLGTRLKKVKAGDMDAIILAAAGVKRLGFENRITEYIDENIMLPAVGQGALCIEIRENDPVIKPLIATLDHRQTKKVVSGERAFLHRLEGGCQVPIAAHGKIENNIFTLNGLVATIDGKVIIKDTVSGSIDNAESIGIQLAENLISMGAKEILENLKNNL